MKTRENVPIAELTTMRLGGAAKYVVEVENPEEVPEAFKFAEEKNLPVFMLGGGANTIGHNEGFDGVIVINKMQGLTIDGEKIRGMGGEVWDDVVALACEHELSGIEALSAIPGTLGAAPVQNIGAYGQDIAQVIESVEAYDTREKNFVTLSKNEMKMGYRKTVFNYGADAGRYFIIAVILKLRRGNLEPPFYNSLQSYIDTHNVTDFSPKKIREMVTAIRAEKLPNPETTASAGSFFKNVYLSDAEADVAEQKGIPVYRKPGENKVNTGWLIENAGLKGVEVDGFRVSDKAALVLINENAKSYANLEKAREYIRDKVKEKFGYEIEQEPVEIPIK